MACKRKLGKEITGHTRALSKMKYLAKGNCTLCPVAGQEDKWSLIIIACKPSKSTTRREDGTRVKMKENLKFTLIFLKFEIR